MKEIKLSIIVPVYNVEQYLDECIQSLLNQTLKNIEIILVDDGSPDNSPQMCDEYAKQDSRIKVIHKVNRGLGYARNSGLEISQGEYVTFIDSDDYIDLKAYKTVCELMDSENLDELRFSCNRFKNDKSHSPLKYTSHPIIISDKKNIELIALCIFDTPKQKYAIYEWGGSSCMAVFRRKIIEEKQLRFVSEREYISEDYIFNFEFYLHSNKIGYLDSTFYHYRINPNSLTRKINLDAIKKAEKYARHIEKMITQDYKMPTHNTIFGMGYYVRALRSNMKFIFLSDLSISTKYSWFKEQINTEYCKYVSKTYPYKDLPIKQKLCYKAIINGNFILSYLIIVLFSKIRKNKFK